MKTTTYNLTVAATVTSPPVKIIKENEYVQQPWREYIIEGD